MQIVHKRQAMYVKTKAERLPLSRESHLFSCLNAPRTRGLGPHGDVDHDRGRPLCAAWK